MSPPSGAIAIWQGKPRAAGREGGGIVAKDQAVQPQLSEAHLHSFAAVRTLAPVVSGDDRSWIEERARYRSAPGCDQLEARPAKRKEGRCSFGLAPALPTRSFACPGRRHGWDPCRPIEMPRCRHSRS